MSRRQSTDAPNPGRLPRAARMYLVVVGLVAVLYAAWLWRPGNRREPGHSPRGVASSAAALPVVPEVAEVMSGYAGSESCRACHEAAYGAWEGSHHGLAERLPRTDLDLAAFEPGRTFEHGSQTTEVRRNGEALEIVSTGLGGSREPRRVERVIGHHPLRQYLVAGPGGRLQTMEASWDPRSNVWFNVYGIEDRQPGEWGHWTGRGMNWNAMCGTCHNTRFRKQYEASTDAYHSVMAERSVGCESCHGPMKDHVSWQRAWQGMGRKDPTLRRPTPAEHMENCAPCHARRGELTGDFAPGDSFWDHYLLSIVDDSRLFYPDGQIWDEDYEYAPFLGSRMHAAGVTCLDCHDPHHAKPRVSGNDLCMRCHNGTRPGSPVIDPARHTFHRPEGPGSRCVDCHMPQTVYMQRHWRHDHGFTSPDPWLTVKYGIPNACNRCHADRDAAWALEVSEKWYGARLQRPARQRAAAMAEARRGEAGAVGPLVALLDTPEVPYWKASSIALLERWIEQPSVRGAVSRQLTHSHPLVRYRAAQALAPLAEAGEPEVTAALRRALDDPARAVRYSAAWALRREVDLESRGGRELRHALALNADQPTGQAQAGAFELARGRPAEAVAHYARSVAWDPGSAALRQDYAVVLSLVGRSAEAVEQIRAAVRLEPGVAEHHYRLALALNEAGHPESTVAALEEAVRLDPRHDRAWYNLGLARHALGRGEAALEALRQAEHLNSADPRIPRARAVLLAQMGRLTEAREVIEQVLGRWPGDAEARDLEGRLPR